MVRVLFSTTCAALVLVVANAASAQVTLKHKFPEGRKATYEAHVKSNQTLTLLGMENETSSEQTLTVSTAIGKRAADGTLKVKSKIDAVNVSLSIAGTELEFDSANPDADPPGTAFDVLLDIFKATAKSSWETVLNQDNRAVAVTGRDAAFKDLPQALRDSMKAQLDPEYLKAAANDEMDKLPAEAVSPGDSWERTNTMRLEAGQKLTFTNKYTYQGSVNQGGKKLEKIVSKTTDIEYTVDAGGPLKVLESNLKIAASEGAILFNVATGQVVSDRSKTQIKGALKLEANGMELPGELDLTFENSTVLK